MTKQKILIVDDNEINRLILLEMLHEKYECLEAKDGNEALDILREKRKEIDLLLLDLVMPTLDGFGVLKAMKEEKILGDVPVIVISSETDPVLINKAYDLGGEDFITRPFDSKIVLHRVTNTIIIHSKQKQLLDIVANDFKEREKLNSMMISMLSHIVEYRNGESGAHVIHINKISGLLLECLLKKTKKYNLTKRDIDLIKNASSFHDIGKLGIPEEILNKPGRLTPEEFEVMKTHSAIGSEMIKNIEDFKNEPLVKYCYEICRWHHEKYDGRGYPDKLVGDQIPISAQVVSLADVYDALTSKRCYKDAYSHEQAINMILNNECGVFNPILIECLLEIKDILKENLQNDSGSISVSYEGEDISKLIFENLEE